MLGMPMLPLQPSMPNSHLGQMPYQQVQPLSLMQPASAYLPQANVKSQLQTLEGALTQLQQVVHLYDFVKHLEIYQLMLSLLNTI